MPTTSSPYAGTWAYAATGSASNEPWGIALSQSVKVVQRRSYTVRLWSRQGEEGNCVGKIKWNGKEMVEFVPGFEYERTSVLFPVGEAREGEIMIELECEGGGKGAGVWVDDVAMEVGWVG
jgi:hypothetical protein